MEPIQMNDEGDILVMYPGSILEQRGDDGSGLPNRGNVVGSHKNCSRAAPELAKVYRLVESEGDFFRCMACGNESKRFQFGAHTYGQAREYLAT